jgi:hypothetical protein
MQFFVVVRLHVAAGKRLFKMLEKLGVHGHHVFEVAVLRAVLHHQYLAVSLDDGCLDLTDLLVQENLIVPLAVNNLLPNLTHTLRAQRIGLARPPQRRLHLLVRL